MTPELANAALTFLTRVDLKGTEAFALVEVVKALQALTVPKPEVPVS